VSRGADRCAERPRRAGLFTLRTYLVLACVLVVVKIVQAGIT
jgi:hypothetical protein